MDDPTQYDPRYVEVDAVPIEIPDSYTDSAKREALFQAESRLEVERTGGVPIDENEINAVHQSAVANLATYHLARPATDNEDVTLGDLDDGGEQTERHSEQYLETYHELVDLLSEAGDNGQTGTYFGAAGKANETVTVNSGRDGRRHNLRSDFRELVHDRFLKYEKFE